MTNSNIDNTEKKVEFPGAQFQTDWYIKKQLIDNLMSSLPYAPNYSIILFSRQRLFPTFLYLFFFLSFVFPFLFGLQLLLVSLLDNLSPFVFLFFSHEKNIYFTFSSHYCFNFLILRDTGDIFIYSIEV